MSYGNRRTPRPPRLSGDSGRDGGTDRSQRQPAPGSRPAPDSRGGARLTDPVRYPQSASSPVRTKRAFILLLLTLVLPGGAQIAAGDRKLGRKALRVTFTVWAVVVLLGLLYLTNRAAVIGLVTHPVLSLLLIAVLVLLAVGWATMFLNTLRLIRPGLLAPGVRPVVGAALVLLMVLTSGSLGYGAYLLNVGRNALGSVFQAGPAFEPVDGRYNFLLIGGDSGDDRLTRRTDSISVLSVDAETGRTVTIGIPRNTQNAPFPEDSPMRQVYPDGYNCGNDCIINSLYKVVNESHSELYPDADNPGAQALKEAVGAMTGLTVQGYVIIDMKGFQKLINAMGGITIKVGGRVPIGGGTDPATGLPGPIKGWIEPGVQKLDGYRALWYARSRAQATDYDRMARQRCVQQAMMSQLDPATLLTRTQAIADAGTDLVESDISQSQLSSFLDLALKAKGQKMLSVAAGPPDFSRDFPTYPDFALLQEKVRSVIDKSRAVQTPKAAESPADSGLRGTSGYSAGGAASLPAPMGAPMAARMAVPVALPAAVEELTPNGTCSVP